MFQIYSPVSIFPNFVFLRPLVRTGALPANQAQPIVHPKRAAFFTPGRDGARANRVFLRKFTVCLTTFKYFFAGSFSHLLRDNFSMWVGFPH